VVDQQVLEHLDHDQGGEEAGGAGHDGLLGEDVAGRVINWCGSYGRPAVDASGKTLKRHKIRGIPETRSARE
jgi:hypothetical protein